MNAKPSLSFLICFLRNREKKERQTIYLNAKTRRLNIVNEHADTGESLEAGFINSQRYTKEYRNKVLRLPSQVRAVQQSDGITVEQKNAYANLMESIKALRGKNEQQSNSSEEWVVKAGDELAVKLVVGTQEKNTCDVGFYYNKEKVGSFTVQDLNSVRIFPYAEVANNSNGAGETKVFFNMGSSRFKVSWLAISALPHSVLIVVVKLSQSTLYSLHLKYTNSRYWPTSLPSKRACASKWSECRVRNSWPRPSTSTTRRRTGTAN